MVTDAAQGMACLVQGAGLARSRLNFSRCVSCGTGDGEAEAEVHTDFLRIVLEVINAILAGNLAANPELVYALLHRHEVFTPLHVHPRCTELLDNIFAVTDFFNAKASSCLW